MKFKDQNMQGNTHASNDHLHLRCLVATIPLYVLCHALSLIPTEQRQNASITKPNCSIGYRIA
jgi:hypothetical protein